MNSIKGRPHGNLVPVNADNANTRDWLVLLEASTIVGHQRGKLRVALVTQERKFVKKRRLFRKAEHSSSSMDSILEYTRCIFVPNSTRMKMERLFP
jgi:hypothetical protein